MARRDDPTGARAVVQTVFRNGSTAGGARPESVTRRAIEERLVAFVREVVKPGRWRVHVPGTHSGGITYEGLLDVLASQDRDFLTNTVQLSLAVSVALRREWLSSQRMPTTRELERSAERPLLDVVEARFSPGNGDIRVARLTVKYEKRKRALGRGGQAIGVSSGELRRAVSRDAYVEWL